MFKRWLAISASAIILLIFVLPQTALAAANISVDAEAGFANKVKYESGVPIQFTLVNNGDNFSGDLVLGYSETYSLGAGISVPVELAEGETKTIQVAVPGLSDMMSMGNASRSIFLYEGSWEDGKQIEVKGDKNLTPSFYSPSSLFLATLTENSDRLLQLSKVAPTGSESTQVFHLNQMNRFALPTEAMAWETIDHLLIDEFSFSDLPEANRNAIMQWVRQGGSLVVGSTENIQAAMGELSEDLPLSLGEPVQLAVPGLEKELPAFQASLNEGAEALLTQGSAVLAARKQMGAGSITQTAFSLGDSQVSSQQGYAEMMEGLLPISISNQQFNQGQSTLEYMSYEVGNVNELFESFAVSKFWTVAIVFFYILLIIPVLYIFLKKRDKRELAWVIIPAIAVITSIGLFAVGAKDRIANPQIQQTGFFKVDTDGGLNGYYMNTLLSNKGGNYQFTAPSSTSMTSLLNNQFSEGSPQDGAILERQASGNQLTMRNMRYWSVGSILGQSYIENTGDFDVQLRVENKQLTGTVKNNFPFALEDVSIWTGTRIMSLGNLNPGEELAVNAKVQSDILPSISPISTNYAYQQIQDKEELETARKQTILSASYNQMQADDSSPYVIAYTKDAIVPVSLKDQRASVSAMNLVAQPFSPETTLTGELDLPAEALTLKVAAANPSTYFENVAPDPYLYYLDGGQIEMTYQTPKALQLDKTEWQTLEISRGNTKGEVAIRNLSTGELEKIEENQSALTKNLTDYISKEGVVNFVVDANTDGNSPEIMLPKIKLKGVVAP